MKHNFNTDPISHKDFTDIMNVMAQVFPTINNKARIVYYYNAVKRLPHKAMKDISQSFLMGSKYAPLPSDFSDAAKAWQKENNFFFDFVEPKKNLCLYCRDSGIVRVQHLSNPDVDELMRCNCDEQWRSEHLKLPVFDLTLKAVYKCEPCPLEWFKPSDLNPSGKEFFGLQKKYMKRISNAEKYWSDLGFKK